MYTYKCLNPIAQVGLDHFSGNYQKVSEDQPSQIILVRSAKMHDMELDKELVCVARAGAGVNNIPLDRCAEQGIVVFNTPGANANGVKELFLFAAIAGVRDILGGIRWAEGEFGNPEIAALAEKSKKQFVGHEIMGKTLGVIGLGAIGVKVANAAVSLGMKVIGYDPYLSEAARASLDSLVQVTDSLDEIAARSQLITIHVPAMAGTIGMINADFLSKCRTGVIFINLARDTLVNEPDMQAALSLGQVGKYICDFPTPGAAAMKNAIIIPHLGASTEESEDNCAVMAVQQIVDFMENGNIRNSVNYPPVDFGRADGAVRLCVAHRSSVKTNEIANLLTKAGAVLKGMTGKEKGDYAYSMFDLTTCPEGIEDTVCVDGILKVRIIHS
ncbi:MAG: 3-phosphoglycerate dehydrogenase [Parasporobacterium sp.]|nr:3-phosphoglycerate dehydrogenase [Parasporobacterium sp.]